MDRTWAEWRQTAHQAKLELVMKGMKCIEQDIDAEGLLTYCLENSVRVDQAARASYAQWLHEKDLNEVILYPALRVVDMLWCPCHSLATHSIQIYWWQ